MAKTTAYSMINVQATLDGIAVRGFWDGDDAMTVTVADVGEMLVGAGGDSIFSQSADQSAEITIRLQHTSKTHEQLVKKWKQQRAGRLNGFPFDFIDKDSGEGGTADKCFISKAPDDQKGQNATVREWTLVTGDYEPLTPNN
ncbi:MAG: hypothetical protein A49_08500 [Methyloceanibacter sp.]|nr:MAG: hypothetical protein A49_08500 [Methyloceanibacter sp.]